MSEADEELVELIRPLGFYNRRSKALRRFSSEYVRNDWVDVAELYGIGKYAKDSWKIFVDGKLLEVDEVEDKELKKFLAAVRTGEKDLVRTRRRDESIDRRKDRASKQASA
jgi:endonuclease III-like uncharacterized protein